METRPQTKKADVLEHPGVLEHVGLLADEPPGLAGLPFVANRQRID